MSIATSHPIVASAPIALQEATDAVLTTYADAEHTQPDRLVQFDPLVLVSILEAIMSLFGDCKFFNPQKLKSECQSPSAGFRLRVRFNVGRSVRRAYDDHDMNFVEYDQYCRNLTNAILATGAKATVDQIKATHAAVTA